MQDTLVPVMVIAVPAVLTEVIAVRLDLQLLAVVMVQVPHLSQVLAAAAAEAAKAPKLTLAAVVELMDKVILVAQDPAVAVAVVAVLVPLDKTVMCGQASMVVLVVQDCSIVSVVQHSFMQPAAMAVMKIATLYSTVDLVV